MLLSKCESWSTLCSRRSVKILPLHSIYLRIWLMPSQNEFYFLRTSENIPFHLFLFSSFEFTQSPLCALCLITMESIQSIGSFYSSSCRATFLLASFLKLAEIVMQHILQALDAAGNFLRSPWVCLTPVCVALDCPSEIQWHVAFWSDWGTYPFNSMLDDLHLNLLTFSLPIWMSGCALPAWALSVQITFLCRYIFNSSILTHALRWLCYCLMGGLWLLTGKSFSVCCIVLQS